LTRLRRAEEPQPWSVGAAQDHNHVHISQLGLTRKFKRLPDVLKAGGLINVGGPMGWLLEIQESFLILQHDAHEPVY
jgi:hypothetical protein